MTKAKRNQIREKSIAQMRAIKKEKIYEYAYKYFEVVEPQTPISSAINYVIWLEKNNRIDEYGNILNSAGEIINVA